MFVCSSCGVQSQKGEGSVVVPTVIRPVLYQYSDGRSYMGDEYDRTHIVCQSCAKTEDALLLRTVKTVEVSCKESSIRTEMR